MYNLFIRPLVMAFALLGAVAMPGGAATQTPSKSITATVTFVDAKAGLMQLKLPEDKTLNMAASTNARACTRSRSTASPGGNRSGSGLACGRCLAIPMTPPRRARRRACGVATDPPAVGAAHPAKAA